MRLALVFLACIACGARVKTADPAEHAPVIEHRAPAAASIETAAAPIETAAAPIGPSIYDLPVGLVTASGARVGLDVARGTPVLVSMFYGSCAVACPLIISELQQVLAELPADTKAQVLLVSFDAARDTPGKLDALARERKLDARFTLAAASDADARALAAVLRVQYRRLANGEFAHGSTIVALDGEGREIARTDSLGHRDPLVHALTAYR